MAMGGCSSPSFWPGDKQTWQRGEWRKTSPLTGAAGLQKGPSKPYWAWGSLGGAAEADPRANR